MIETHRRWIPRTEASTSHLPLLNDCDGWFVESGLQALVLLLGLSLRGLDASAFLDRSSLAARRRACAERTQDRNAAPRCERRPLPRRMRARPRVAAAVLRARR